MKHNNKNEKYMIDINLVKIRSKSEDIDISNIEYKDENSFKDLEISTKKALLSNITSSDIVNKNFINQILRSMIINLYKYINEENDFEPLVDYERNNFSENEIDNIIDDEIQNIKNNLIKLSSLYDENGEPIKEDDDDDDDDDDISLLPKRQSDNDRIDTIDDIKL